MAKTPWITTKVQVLQLGAQIIFGLFGGAAVLAAITGIAQKFMGLSLDWWILSLVFIGGVLLMLWAQSTFNSGAKVTALPVQLSANQIIYPYPSKNGVLWEWSATVGMTGPFCPIHRGRLFYLAFMGSKRADFKEDDWLGSNGSFVCTVDNEEFIFIRPSSMQIGNLRAQAKEHFQIEQERKKLSEQ